VAENAIWQVDRSDSVSGELNGFAMRCTTGRGAVVYVIATGILQRHDEFQRPDGDVVLGGFDGMIPCLGQSMVCVRPSGPMTFRRSNLPAPLTNTNSTLLPLAIW
jgi:hypothetical protein